MWTPLRFFRKSPQLSPDTPEWLELWAIARYDLKLSDREFWDLSADQFSALLKRRSIELERQDFHAAQICCTLANIFRDKKSKAYQPADFMPNPKRKTKQTPDQMLEIVKGWQAFYGKKT